MKIKEQSRKLAAGCTWVRQGESDVVWIWFSKSIRLMEDKQMGFYVMLASMLLGLLALEIGFSQFKEKKDKFLSILTSLAGLALVLVAVWLGWPK